MTTPILVTGAAGFIGFHTARALLERGDEVIGVDNLTPYYDVELKRARLAELAGAPGFRFERLDLADREAVDALFRRVRPQRVVHLAAQAGVRYSITHPWSYVDSNLTGFMAVLEGCRAVGVAHLVYASSSSVYGATHRVPFSEHDPADHPVSLYAATKRANELLAHSYSHLYRLPCTGLRFFTVYGPWGRPDMAYYLFADAIASGRPIRLFNGGNLDRDFTYVDDVVESVVRLVDTLPAPAEHASDPARSSLAPYRVYNIGNHSPVTVLELVRVLEHHLGRAAITVDEPMQPGDVPTTYADVTDLAADIGFAPSTPLDVGIGRFVDWYRAYHGAEVEA